MCDQRGVGIELLNTKVVNKALTNVDTKYFLRGKDTMYSHRKIKKLGCKGHYNSVKAEMYYVIVSRDCQPMCILVDNH